MNGYSIRPASYGRIHGQILSVLIIVAFLFILSNGCTVEKKPVENPSPSQSASMTGDSADEEGYYELPPLSFTLTDGRNINVPPLKINMKRAYPAGMEWQCYSHGALNYLFGENPGKPLYREVEKKLLDNMGLKEGMYVADVGCGEGNYVFALADAVGSSGRVYATDIEPNSAVFIRWKIDVAYSGVFEAAGLKKIGKGAYENIICQSNLPDDVKLPEKKFDWLFLNQVHYCTDRNGDVEVMRKFTDSLKKALKPGGKIFMTEWVMAEKEDIENKRTADHFMTMDEIVARLESFGLKVLKREESQNKESGEPLWKKRTVLIMQPR